MFKKRKSSSAVLLGSAAASMAACSAQNTAKAINVLDVLKAPWVAERWLSYDSWVELDRMAGVNPLVAIFIGLPALCLAAAWVAYNGLIIAGVWSGINKVRNYHKQKENKAMLEGLDSGKQKVDELAKKRFNQEDFEFIKNIEKKYGKEYSDSLKESFLKYLLKCEVGSETKSCEKYFEDFVLDHPESDDYFNRHKNVAEKDYGLIGPKVVTQEDKKFIDEEFSSLKEELEFLKEKRKFKSDQDTLEDFLSSYVEYCHLCNKRKKEEKELEKSGKNSLSAKEYFFGAYMNNISAKTAINGFEYLAPGGNDYSVNKYWNAKDKGYGLRYENTLYSPNNLNDVSYEDSELFEKMLIKSSNEKEVKDCFKEYVFYLHDCNKQFKKAEKGFKAFCREENFSIEGLENAEQLNS